MISLEEFQAFANGLGRGYLKQWKAASMLRTLQAIPKGDRDRLRGWVANCLEMEGFNAAGVDAVTDFLAKR